MGMLQRSIDLLTIYGIPTLFQMLATGGASAGPSVPSGAAGGARCGMTIHSHSRHRNTHAESSSREPTPDDDESDEEVESSQGEARIARIQILTAELAAMILDLCPGKGQGQAPMFKATDIDPDILLLFSFLLYFSFYW